MRVIATAGHVDHGKSTLVRALTGMEPDRWAEERRRGMTIDLGYAWTTLADGTELAFVDVPGHQRFIGNMLAGLGPAPAVLFVVAADSGWSRQSEEHLAAADALGLTHAVLAVTRSDLVDPGAALAEARDRLDRSTLRGAEAVAISGRTGAGVPDLRAALECLVARMPTLDPEQPMRLWVDRVFTVRGSGTVVTGTLASGSVAVGDTVELRGRPVTVRGVQALGEPRARLSAPARVALNLRGVARDDVARGDVLLTPAAWHWTSSVDARLRTTDRLPEQLMLHVGSAAQAVRVRPLGRDGDDLLARIRLARPLALRAGDRALLRDPGREVVVAGVLVLDADPPAFSRRGAAAARAVELAGASGEIDGGREIARRGAMRREHLTALGASVPPGTREHDGWLLDEQTWGSWVAAAASSVRDWAAREPLDPAMPVAALRRRLRLPSDAVAVAVAAAAGLMARDGRVAPPEPSRALGAAEEGLRRIEERLSAAPFAAPEAGELAEWGLDRRALAAAERAGRLVRIAEQIVLLPTGPDEALRRLGELPQPFSTSQARQALGTTRRVAVPLLEYLDARGETQRLDAATRRLVADA